MDARLSTLYHNLREQLRSLECVAVAFSGGVDSSLLAFVAHDVLAEKAIAVHMASAFTGTREEDEARAFCEAHRIPLEVVEVDVLADDAVASNPPERCYLCKHKVFEAIIGAARAHGIDCVVDGSNVDDQGDYRPGMRALAELGVRSPLLECGFTKADVRALGKELGLSVWNKPSAACLASRIPYGERITAEKLARVDAAEEVLHGLGFAQCRVRSHADTARIEVPLGALERLVEEPCRAQVAEQLRRLGFAYVTVDLAGFRSGSMNEVL